MLTLHIGNKNYSSWSLRPWLLMRAHGIAFEEVLHRFGRDNLNDGFRAFSPNAKVPCLVDDGLAVWDSLAIAEYLAERHRGVWPNAAEARAFARCAAAEMHSGFTTLRGQFGMNVGVRVQVKQHSPALQADIDRVLALWNAGLARFGGPYLAGDMFTAVDAFYAPVAFRFQSFGVAVAGAAADYLQRLLAHPAMRDWEAQALAEEFRDPEHDAELAMIGTITADLRAVVGGGGLTA
ncbi:MAG: glutathione S-transferase [Xanthomonadaceae bacterium]|nr:glutathione S-transferase [Xanthomonadaceae bacterium]MDP2185885.1 glutathione S-transferase [Xanthomonadales bacterium]MDZ4116297.1 glutathione S-transferase [Xanthomonadaceae bacterium]MDZ4377942.1 glutathione S-transferase [Xanthomonadaceae bacterium]